MRIFAIAAMAACVSGAAWADERADRAAASAAIDLNVITNTLENHYARELAAQEATVRAAAISSARVEISQAMSEVESELYQSMIEDGRTIQIDADLVRALGRAERAVARASAELDHTQARLQATAN